MELLYRDNDVFILTPLLTINEHNENIIIYKDELKKQQKKKQVKDKDKEIENYTFDVWKEEVITESFNYTTQPIEEQYVDIGDVPNIYDELAFSNKQLFLMNVAGFNFEVTNPNMLLDTRLFNEVALMTDYIHKKFEIDKTKFCIRMLMNEYGFISIYLIFLGKIIGTVYPREVFSGYLDYHMSLAMFNNNRGYIPFYRTLRYRNIYKYENDGIYINDIHIPIKIKQTAKVIKENKNNYLTFSYAKLFLDRDIFYKKRDINNLEFEKIIFYNLNFENIFTINANELNKEQKMTLIGLLFPHCINDYRTTKYYYTNNLFYYYSIDKELLALTK